MVRPRLIPIARAAQTRQLLRDHELGVLSVLSRVRLATLNHMQRLAVVDGPINAHTRRAQRLMTKLTKLGVVVRFARRVGGVRTGSSGYVYGLSGLGWAVVTFGTSESGKRHKVMEATPYFQDHMLAVTELYVQLIEQSRLGQGELLAFDAEPKNWRHFTGLGGELIQVKPDAYVRLGRKEAEYTEYSSFVEVDLATETLPTILKKSQRYVDYWWSGTEQKQRVVFPYVVWLAPTEHRVRGISSAIGKLAVENQVLFKVGLLGDGPKLLSGGTPEEQTDQAAQSEQSGQMEQSEQTEDTA